MNNNEIDRYANAHAGLLADLADIMDAIENMPDPESADYGDMAQLGRLADFIHKLAVAAGTKDDI